MHRTRGGRVRLGLAALSVLALATTSACGGGDEGGDGSAGEPVTVTVGTFNEFGYEGLIEEWNASHDDIKVEQVKVGTWDDAKANLYTKLAAGSGLSDIEGIEGDAMPAILAEDGAFADLSDPDLDGRWRDWVADAGTNADGELIGYGTDIGPEGVCYRSDLFAKAGLPTDRAQVAALMGTWDDYFALGERFVKAMPDTAWYDSTGGVAQAMINQVANPFETDDDTVDVENPDLEAVWAAVTGNVEKGLSSRLSQWGDDWTASFTNDGFATMTCPGWMLGIIQGNAPEVKGWDIADAFPDGGGNWGGSYLTVPAMGDHIEQAKEVAAWLTAPEQQAKAFAAKGPFPSQVDAMDLPEITSATNPFFNDAPTGQIYASRAAAVKLQPHKGPKYSDILQAFQAALLRVDDGSQTPDGSWDQFLKDVEALA